MVARLLSLLYREWNGLHQAAFLLALSSLSAQLLALLRDRLLAATFGASTELDIYYSAFRLPDLIFVSFASFVSVTVLIPFIIRAGKDGGEKQVEKFISSLFTVFFGATVVVGAVAFVLMPYLAPLFAPGFEAEALTKLIFLSRLLLVSPLLLGISNLLGSVTQSYRKFFAYTLSPVVYNAGIIVGILFLFPIFGLPGLAGGVIVGACLHLLVQVPSVLQIGIRPRFLARVDWAETWEVIKVSLPRTLALSGNQLALAVLVALGSLMATGSIAIFNLAFNLQSVPLIVVGVSYSVAAFPTLAALFSNGEGRQFVTKIELAIRHIMFWSLPAMTLFIVLRAHLVRAVFGTGNFSWSDTRLVAAALALFIVSVAGQALVQLFVRAYYASNNTKIPLLINLSSSLVVIGLAFVLTYSFGHYPVFQFFIENLLRVEDLAGVSILMLPLAYSGGILLNALLYWIFFRRHFGAFSREVTDSIFRSFAGAIVGGFAAYHTLGLFGPLVDQTTYVGIMFQGIAAGLSGLVFAIGTLWILGSVELKEFYTALSAKVWRNPISAGSEEI